LKLPCIKMLACLYCLGKGKACSLEPLLAEESCEADGDGDVEEVGTGRATALTSMAVMVQTAEAPEVMEEVQATEEAVVRVLGEGLDMEEVPGASTTVRASTAELETVPRQG